MEEEPSEVCSPSQNCELCPHHWRVSLESEDETINGEFESCTRWGRRERFDCTSFYGTFIFTFAMKRLLVVCTCRLFYLFPTSVISYLVYFIELESLEKATKSRAEYRPCRYTDSDEQLRMVRSYVFCERNNMDTH